MKTRLHPLPLVLALTALVASIGNAADEDQVLIRRMPGTYTDGEVIVRQQPTGNPDIYLPLPVTVRIPRGKGRIEGAIAGVVPISGQVTHVRVSGRKVIYTGRLNLYLQPYVLRQPRFRAVASAAGPRRETLALTIKASGDIAPGINLSISGKFRGTK